MTASMAFREKNLFACLQSPKSAYMNCNQLGRGNNACNSSTAPILPRDKLSASRGLDSIEDSCRTAMHSAIRDAAIRTFNTHWKWGCWILEQLSSWVPPNGRGDLEFITLRRGKHNDSTEPAMAAPKLLLLFEHTFLRLSKWSSLRNHLRM